MPEMWEPSKPSQLLGCLIAFVLSCVLVVIVGHLVANVLLG